MLMAETPIPKQIGIALGGVALEVTMQHAFTLGHRQLVIRTGKVIHTDKLIARLCQEGDGFLQDIEFCCGLGRSASLILR